MENNENMIEGLFDKASDYGKTSIELAKLKLLDKTSGVLGALVPHSIVLILIASFLIFLNLGLAFWLGAILGKIFYGFFVVAACDALAGLIVYFLLHNWLKKVASDYFIKSVLK